jgi:hypothetical protein
MAARVSEPGAMASAIPETKISQTGVISRPKIVCSGKKPLAELRDFGKIEGTLHGSGDLRRRYSEARIAFRIKSILPSEPGAMGISRSSDMPRGRSCFHRERYRCGSWCMSLAPLRALDGLDDGTCI